MVDGQEPEKRIFDAGNASDEEGIAGAFSIEKSPFSPSQEPEKTPEKHTYCVTGAQKGEFMRTGLTKQEKTTDIWFDEKDPPYPYSHPQHRLKEAACRLRRTAPRPVPPDRRRPGHGLHGV